ncbi:hypothetical protein Syun_008341 [Stephania yunnanensis]|uniref:Polyphenol oxidase C-terminal domain-containing protein n=1 Tax=Stephania yunnanensis TaxID=152371 RepID=A0AAP0KEZ2_9MAGN
MASASALPESGLWPRPLDSVIRVLVPRPPRPQNRGDAEKDVEILVVNGVEVKNNRAVKFDVYIDKPYGDGIKSTNSSELGVLAGSLVDLARLKGGRKLRLNLCLDWVLEEIGAVESPVLLVSLVPRMGSDITIGGNHLITNRRGALLGLGLGLLTWLLPGTAIAAPPPEPLSEFGPGPRPLNSTIRVLVPRPPKPSTYREDENVLVLIVDGVEVKDNEPVRLDVYVAKPDEGQVGSDDDLGEFAGSLIDLARLRTGRRARKTDLDMGITNLVKQIGAEKCEKLLVSLVPRTGAMVVDGVHIENFKAE